MVFDLHSTGLFKIKKHGHSITRETLMYKSESCPLFGLVELNSDLEVIWALIHIPSERVIIAKFKTKEEIENYCDYLMSAVDLNCLLLCTPKFEDIDEQLRYDVEISYKKYLVEKREFELSVDDNTN